MDAGNLIWLTAGIGLGLFAAMVGLAVLVELDRRQVLARRRGGNQPVTSAVETVTSGEVVPATAPEEPEPAETEASAYARLVAAAANATSRLRPDRKKALWTLPGAPPETLGGARGEDTVPEDTPPARTNPDTGHDEGGEPSTGGERTKLLSVEEAVAWTPPEPAREPDPVSPPAPATEAEEPEAAAPAQPNKPAPPAVEGPIAEAAKRRRALKEKQAREAAERAAAEKEAARKEALAREVAAREAAEKAAAERAAAEQEAARRIAQQEAAARAAAERETAEREAAERKAAEQETARREAAEAAARDEAAASANAARARDAGRQATAERDDPVPAAARDINVEELFEKAFGESTGLTPRSGRDDPT